MFTHIDHGFVFEDIESVTSDDGRYYKVPSPFGDGFVHYDSVTTVINHDKKEFFEKWRAIPGNAKKGEIAGERGNIIHDEIERYLNNESSLCAESVDHQSMLNSMKKYLNNINNVHALEVPLYSHMLELAGRVDCVAEYEGVLSIIDFKGSDKIKKEKWIENYFIQATAYSIMWEEMTGQVIDQLVIIMGNEAGFCQIFKKKIEDYVPRLYRVLLKYDENIKKETNHA